MSQVSVWFCLTCTTGVVTPSLSMRRGDHRQDGMRWNLAPAAFFAFDSMAAEAASVSVYIALRDGRDVMETNSPEISLLGPYIRSHRRHLVQQSRYTICTLGSQLWNHERAINEHHAFGINGEVYKIKIPKTQRSLALKRLDLMNVNPHSLFDSDESVMRTICRREGLFRHFPS